MAFLEPYGKVQAHARGPVPAYAKMPRAGRVIIDPAQLRHWREVRFMSRRDLAELARVSVESVKSYELSLRFPREKTFRRLCTALAVEPEELLFEDCKYVRANVNS